MEVRSDHPALKIMVERVQGRRSPVTVTVHATYVLLRSV